MSKLVISATTLSLLSGTAWKGALLLGSDETGKNDLAFGAVETGCVLISKGHTTLWSSGGQLYAAATDEAVSHRVMTRLHLAVLIQNEGPTAPRGEQSLILGHAVPTLRLDPRRPSALSQLMAHMRQA